MFLYLFLKKRVLRVCVEVELKCYTSSKTLAKDSRIRSSTKMMEKPSFSAGLETLLYKKNMHIAI